MDKSFIKRCIVEALTEVYKLQPALTDMQAKFIRLALEKIFPSVEKPQPLRKTAIDDVYYECDVCGKKCSSTPGLTLHKKKHKENPK